jgi:sodium/bile acid cotransporter 7
MTAFFKRQWFLTGLTVMIAAGMTLGIRGYGPQVTPVADLLRPQATTALVLFLMSFSLDSDHLWAALRAPKPVLLGYTVNFGVIPILAWLLVPLQQVADFRVGLMIAACVPCTTAAASVMTRKARGNDAVSLLTTLTTNMSCWFITPLWLHWTTATTIVLPIGAQMVELLKTVLVPTLAGQFLRQEARLKAFAVRHKAPISVAAQVLIELMVFTAALKAGMALHAMNSSAPVADAASVGARQFQTTTHDNPRVASNPTRPRGTASAQPATTTANPGRITTAALAVVWGSCVALHVAGLAVGWFTARGLGIGRPESIATAFAGSQKTLPIGLMLSVQYGGDYPFAMFPMLLYHASQLFLDTIIASQVAGPASTEQDSRVDRD